MRQEKRWAAAVGGLLAAALAGAGAAGVVAHAQAAAPTVAVTLKEFTIAPAPKLKPGKVTFVAANKGKFPHALEIAGPGVKARTPVIAPGKAAKLTVTLKAGSYTLWCPVRNHAALGMRLTAKVGATAAGGGAGAATSGAGATGDGTTGSGSTAGTEWG